MIFPNLSHHFALWLALFLALPGGAPANPEAIDRYLDDRPARPDLAQDPSLENLLRYAALGSPKLQAAYLVWQADLQKLTQARGLPQPRVSYSLYLRSVETRVGPQRQSISLQQTLPWPGKRALLHERAAQAAEASRLAFEQMRLELFSQVRKAWVALILLERTIAIEQESIELLKTWEEVARAQYRAGRLPQSVLVRAQLELGRLEDQLQSLVARKPALLAELNALLGRPPGEPLALRGEIPRLGRTISREDLFVWMETDSRELEMLRRLLDKDTAQVKLAQKDFWPDITTRLSVIDTGGALSPELEDSGKNPVLATVSVPLPIWRRQLHARVEEAKLQERAGKQRVEATRLRLQARIEQILFELGDSGRKLSLYENTLLPLARQAFETTATAFASGDADFQDFIDTQRQLLELELAREQALSRQFQQWALLEPLIGRELPLQKKSSLELSKTPDTGSVHSNSEGRAP